MTTTINSVGLGLSGATGTGNFVGSTDAVLVNPALGTPASGDLSNCTAIPAAELVGEVLPVNGGTGIASPTIHALLVAQGAAVFNEIQLADGELLIGSTGADPVAAALIAGTNVTIDVAAGSITINADSGAFAWSAVSGTSQAMAVNAGYIANNAALVTLTLPAVAAVGAEVAVVGNGAGGWLIAQNAGQNIVVSPSSTTAGVAGSLASSAQYDSIMLVCTVANTTWVSLAAPQSAGLVIV